MKAIFALIAALFVTPVQALMIEVELVSFEFTSAQYNGEFVKAGIVEFRQTQGNKPRLGLEFICQFDTFKAITIEPMKTANLGDTYWLLVEEVPRSPSPARPGKYETLLGIATALQWRRVEDIESQFEVSVAQIAAWEAIQEPVENPFDIYSGEAQPRGMGQNLVQFLGTAPLFNELIGYRLPTIGTNFVRFPNPTITDFFIFTHPADPLPVCP